VTNQLLLSRRQLFTEFFAFSLHADQLLLELLQKLVSNGVNLQGEQPVLFLQPFHLASKLGDFVFFEAAADRQFLIVFEVLKAFIDLRKSPFTAGQLLNKRIDVDSGFLRQRRLVPLEVCQDHHGATTFQPAERVQQLLPGLVATLRLVTAQTGKLAR